MGSRTALDELHMHLPIQLNRLVATTHRTHHSLATGRSTNAASVARFRAEAVVRGARPLAALGAAALSALDDEPEADALELADEEDDEDEAETELVSPWRLTRRPSWPEGGGGAACSAALLLGCSRALFCGLPSTPPSPETTAECQSVYASEYTDRVFHDRMCTCVPHGKSKTITPSTGFLEFMFDHRHFRRSFPLGSCPSKQHLSHTNFF